MFIGYIFLRKRASVGLVCLQSNISEGYLCISKLLRRFLLH